VPEQRQAQVVARIEQDPRVVDTLEDILPARPPRAQRPVTAEDGTNG